MQRCYSSSNPPPSVQQVGGTQNSVQTPGISVPTVAGQQINNVVIPQPAVMDPQMYGRCYGLPQPLTPNPSDKDFPSITRRDVPAVDGEVTPAQVIQLLVGRCYGPPVPLTPNPKDKDFPDTPTPPGPPGPPPVEPGEIIRELVGRCYPKLPPLLPPPPDILPPTVTPPIIVDPLICWLINDLNVYTPSDTQPLQDWLPCGGGIEIEIPDPKCPDCQPIVVTTDTFDCNNVKKLKRQKKAKRIRKNGMSKRTSGWWKNLETGEELYCPLDRPTEEEWEKCVRNTLQCTFGQYYGGGWTPPATNCGSQYPKKFSLNQGEVCVENCVPQRRPVYESVNDDGEHDYNITTAKRSGYDKLPTKGSSHKPVWYILEDEILGQNSGKGANVEMRWIEDDDLRVRTTNKAGVGNGVYIVSEDGGRFWPTSGSGLQDDGSDVEGDQYDGTARFQNLVINFSVIPLYQQEDGKTRDIDSKWTITSWSGTLPGAGEEFEHTFVPTQNGIKGNPITISFVITGQDSGDRAIALFKYRSSSGIRDNFLTTNPGKPDGDGQGERESMNAQNMVFDSILGFAFQKKSDGISYLCEGEELHALHRFYNSSTGDHKYTIDPEIPDEPPQLISPYFAYRIPADPRDDLQIVIDCEKGSAGYDNALGVYLADEDGPQEGFVVVPSATSGNIYEITLQQSDLENYAGDTFGFFLIPDGGGRNNLNSNTSFSFNKSGDGYKGNGISTAEDNYCLFSDRRWNPGAKDFTKWKGERHQFWEDLINGDDDYDDLRFWHKLAWNNLQEYEYEGVQCYVYKDEAPPRVMLKLDTKNDCDPRGFKNNFRDMYISRLECGTLTSTVETWDTAWECGSCTGEYDTTMERSQTIEAVNAATYKLKSFGGVTGGLNSSCIRFTMKMWKNGSSIFSRTMEAGDWPVIGADLYDGTISVDPGDTLKFKITELLVGPPNGNISPVAALYDTGREKFDHQWVIRLVTMANQTAQGQLTAANGNLVNLPGGGLNAIGGRITGLQMAFLPNSADAREGKDWRAGSPDGASHQVEVNDRRHEEYLTQVWSNGSPVNMPNLHQNNPEIFGGARRTEFNPLLPNRTGGFCDTGYPEQALNRYKNGSNLGYLFQKIGGSYNELVQQHLITRWEFDEPPVGYTNSLKKYSPTLFAKQEKPWYMIGDDDLQDTAQSFFSANPFMSPNTFMQDYYLTANAKQLDVLEGGNYLTQLAKVRVAFHFYSTMSIPARFAGRGFVYEPQWMCAIELVSVLQQGWGYSEGMEFTLHWPPKRDDTGSDDQYSPMEDPAISPFYPSRKKQRRLNAYFERNDFRVKRTAKEVIYQESHDKSSAVWYLTNDNLNKRVTFNIRISDVTEGND